MSPKSVYAMLLLPLVAGCKALPKDPFVRAQRAGQSGDFLAALGALDTVPPSHPRYTEARSYAQALERRIRTSYELVLQGLARRAEWRDREALESFGQAKDVWPELRDVAGLIRATRRRIEVLGEGPRGAVSRVPAAPAGEVSEVPSVTTTPVVGPSEAEGALSPEARSETKAPAELAEQAGAVAGAENGGESKRAAREPESLPAPKTPVAGADQIRAAKAKERRRQQGLQKVQRVLELGEMEQAMDLLEDLRSAFPEDRQVASMLARVLHQRALLSYGQGRLEAAIDDWDWVVRLQPSNRQAKAFLRAARTEIENRKRR